MLQNEHSILTHDLQVHGIARTVTFDVRGNTGVVAGLMSRHRLQRQCGTAHDDATLGVVLYGLILRIGETNK